MSVNTTDPAAAMAGLLSRAQPVVPRRGLHLDLKGLPPTFDRLIELLDLFAAARYNLLLVEWEDMFPWTVDERFRCETAYTPQQVQAFAAAAGDRGLEVMPLVQCLGHMETPLSLAKYAPLREVADDAGVLNPLADGARALVEVMVDDVLALTPNVKYLHLGGDEAWSFGSHPDTKAYIAKHGKGALYLHHVGPLLDKLNDRGIRPILWHDMMIEWDEPALRSLATKADLMVWGYQGHPDRCSHHYATRHIERFASVGVPMWGGTAYKGADGEDVDLPNYANREENALAWAEVAQRFVMKGVVATAWSRYSTHRVQNEPIDAALDAMVNVGVILHDGAPPRAGRASVEAALDAVGEGRRFRMLRDAFEKLGEARGRGWWNVRRLSQLLAMQRSDRRRRLPEGPAKALRMLQGHIDAAEAAGREAREAMRGVIDELWLDRYMAERIDPLRRQHQYLRREADAVAHG